MEIVIKIPDKLYETIISDEYGVHQGCIYDIIRNGTPLPKGHGRLIDADAFESRCMFDSSIKGMEDVIYALSGYEPIIEADKGESEVEG